MTHYLQQLGGGGGVTSQYHNWGAVLSILVFLLHSPCPVTRAGVLSICHARVANRLQNAAAAGTTQACPQGPPAMHNNEGRASKSDHK